jgi:hypothetical protein
LDSLDFVGAAICAMGAAQRTLRAD